ncbi:hypothetical protein QYE76_034054 [Lolium multiflorum]|uniref:RING-type E3 ubiquitin transferase n=1 Tax=Lolium multiflorum TaxID=4521 RepID=A0AAD8QWX8_LOLMU|nr:hypothetical protein QYE76_034054 [Lolium multiflorum]
MAQLPPGISPPPPSWSFPPSLPRLLPPPPPEPPLSNHKPSTSQAWIIVGIIIAFVTSLLVLITVWAFCKYYRHRRAHAAAAPADTVVRPLPEHGSPAVVEERPLRQAYAANPTAVLPAFMYSRSVKHNLAGGGEEAATCSVCLEELQLGETVRLLPVCLHLYHAQCIDAWLDAHSTCPLCRSDTDRSDTDPATHPVFFLAWLRV